MTTVAGDENAPLMAEGGAGSIRSFELSADCETPKTQSNSFRFVMGVLGVCCAAAALLLLVGLGSLKPLGSGFDGRAVELLTKVTKTIKKEAKNRYEDNADFQKCHESYVTSISTIANPLNRSLDEPWPKLASGAAYDAISKCLTMSPICDPSSMASLSDTEWTPLRNTYPQLSTPLVQAYALNLQNDPLMAALHKACAEADKSCAKKDFANALLQLTLEVNQVGKLVSYYEASSNLLTRLSARFQVSLEQNMQVLLESDTKVTTTTGAPKKHLWVKIVSMSLDVLTIVGATMGIPPTCTKEVEGSMKKVQTMGTFISATATVGSSVESIGTQSAQIHNNKQANSASGDNGPSSDGSAQDNDLDIEETTIAIYVAKAQNAWQNTLSMQRKTIAQNWGRLEAAMPLAQFCTIGDEEVSLALDKANPALEWLSLSVLIPSKYVIYKQRDYKQTTISVNFQSATADCWAPCGSNAGQKEVADISGTGSTADGLPGGCYEPLRQSSVLGKGKGETSAGRYDATLSMQGSDIVVPNVHLWLGQDGDPDNGPAQSFWMYLLRMDQPIWKYIKTYAATQLANYPKELKLLEEALAKEEEISSREIKLLSDFLMSFCSFIPKTYTAPKAMGTGGIGYPSSTMMRCDILGAPWFVRWVPDCYAAATFNGWFCQSGSGGSGTAGCSTPIANANNQIWVPKNRYNYKELIPGKTGLKGCCFWMHSDCDFPVCDCATLATGLINNFHGCWGDMDCLAREGSVGSVKGSVKAAGIFWGACSPKTYLKEDMSGITSSSDYLMTSLGVPWSEVYTSYGPLIALSKALQDVNDNGVTWQEVAAESTKYPKKAKIIESKLVDFRDQLGVYEYDYEMNYYVHQ